MKIVEINEVLAESAAASFEVVKLNDGSWEVIAHDGRSNQSLAQDQDFVLAVAKAASALPKNWIH